MGEYKDKTGKTRVGTFLQTVAPDVLDFAGDLTGVSALNKLGDMIQNSDVLSEQDKNIALEMLKLDIDDRRGARDMQVAALSQDDLFSKRFVYYLTSAIFAILLVLIVLLFFVDIPEGNGEIIYMAVGMFLGIVSTVAAFFFGSSSGSKEKQDGILKTLQGRKR